MLVFIRGRSLSARVTGMHEDNPGRRTMLMMGALQTSSAPSSDGLSGDRIQGCGSRLPRRSYAKTG